MIANAGILMALGGFYVIYTNKNRNGYPHFTTYHGQAGLALIVSAIGAGMAGGVFLHPDFGMDKTNQTIRKAHRTFARLVLGGVYLTAFFGMTELTTDFVSLAIMGLPLVALAPLTLM